MEPDSLTHPVRRGGGIQPWVQAARPLAFPMIFLPLLAGQALAMNVHGSFAWSGFFHTLGFGVLYQVMLLYLNDASDEAVDRNNHQYFLSGGSRVLPEGKLHRKDLLIGAGLAFLALMGFSAWVTMAHDQPGFLVGAALAVVLCWAYHHDPFKLSYRGFGEVLQGLGCGVLLPLMGFYTQHGSLQGFPWLTLVPLFLIFYVGNIVTALPDTPSDTLGNKNTFPVRHGEFAARRMAIGLLMLACLCVALVGRPPAFLSLTFIVLPAAAVLSGLVLSGLLARADASSFAQCRRFVTWVSVCQAWLLCAWIGTLLMGSSP